MEKARGNSKRWETRLPLEGSEAARAVMNDSPVDCQNREWTEPQRDKGDRRTAVDEVVAERLYIQ